jgi:hypothetical protein
MRRIVALSFSATLLASVLLVVGSPVATAQGTGVSTSGPVITISATSGTLEPTSDGEYALTLTGVGDEAQLIADVNKRRRTGTATGTAAMSAIALDKSVPAVLTIEDDDAKDNEYAFTLTKIELTPDGGLTAVAKRDTDGQPAILDADPDSSKPPESFGAVELASLLSKPEEFSKPNISNVGVAYSVDFNATLTHPGGYYVRAIPKAEEKECAEAQIVTFGGATGPFRTKAFDVPDEGCFFKQSVVFWNLQYSSDPVFNRALQVPFRTVQIAPRTFTLICQGMPQNSPAVCFGGIGINEVPLQVNGGTT